MNEGSFTVFYLHEFCKITKTDAQKIQIEKKRRKDEFERK